MYYLWLDDIRDPMVHYHRVMSTGQLNEIEEIKWVKDYDECIATITKYGLPYHISFDHDLGEDPRTGYDVAKYIINLLLDNPRIKAPTISVHSDNPVGSENILKLFISYNVSKIIN